MTEIWKDVKNYEGRYQVSNLGRVKSLARIDILGRHLKERILKGGETEDGYTLTMLWKNNKGETKYFHRLVAEAFVPNPENKKEVNHIDGNKKNNTPENLEWMTSSENQIHAYDNGLQLKGENHGQSKLKWIQVHWIRKHYVKGDKNFGQKALTRKFKVSPSTIKDIIENKTWKEN